MGLKYEESDQDGAGFLLEMGHTASHVLGGMVGSGVIRMEVGKDRNNCDEMFEWPLKL